MELLKEVISIVKQAGREVLRIYNSGFWVREKEKGDPVTKADLASEKIILAGLKKFGYEVLSEETEDDFKRLQKERLWLVDPLDGTQEFIHKTGEFSLMVGLAEKGRPILGVVYQPTEDKLYWAEAGKGAFLYERGGKRKLSVSNVAEIKQVRPIASKFHLTEDVVEFAKRMSFQEMEYMGSLGLKLGRMAEGEADVYLNTRPKTWEWDTCAADIILREAGGILTDMWGREIKYNKKDARNLNGLLATNGLLQQKILKEIKNFF